MKKIQRLSRVTQVILALCLILCPFSVMGESFFIEGGKEDQRPMLSDQEAQKIEKLSPDLRKSMNWKAGDKVYRVIVQTSDHPALVSTEMLISGHIKDERIFTSISGFACTVNHDGIDALLSDSRVTRISPDRIVFGANDVTRKTTGVDNFNGRPGGGMGGETGNNDSTDDDSSDDDSTDDESTDDGDTGDEESASGRHEDGGSGSEDDTGGAVDLQVGEAFVGSGNFSAGGGDFDPGSFDGSGGGFDRQGEYDFGDYNIQVAGAGITIALMDSGIDNSHLDLHDRLVISLDFTSGHPQPATGDGYGHGTHVAGTILGTAAQALLDGYEIFPAGMAPKAGLVSLKVLDDTGAGSVSNVIAAIDFVIQNNHYLNIRIINLSLGHPVYESYTADPFCQAVEAAVHAGIIVVCSAGNLGKYDGIPVYGGITTPGNDPLAITAGATKSVGTYIRSDDVMASYSSRGPTLVDGLLKPDLVAPGDSIISVMSDNCFIMNNYPGNIVPPALFTEDTSVAPAYLYLSGTSMSAPAVSGIIALMLEANGSLSPNLVKAILMYTAERMKDPNIFEQGAGLVNAEGAVRLAYLTDPNYSSLDVGDALLITDSLIPWSFIMQEKIQWGVSFHWGDDLIWGDGILWADRSVWGNGTEWEEGIIWDEGILWADRAMTGNCVMYEEATFWGEDIETPEGVPVRWHDVVMDHESAWGDNMVDPDSIEGITSEDVLIHGESAAVEYMEFIDHTSPYYPCR